MINFRFAIDGQLNLLKIFLQLTDHNITTHADELCYIFKCNAFQNIYPSLEPEDIERQTIDKMINFWTNFIKYG